MKTLVAMAILASIGMTTIRDDKTLIIGYTDPAGTRTNVYNKCTVLIGWVSQEGTYDKVGRKLSDTALPGLLIQQDRAKGNCR